MFSQIAALRKKYFSTGRRASPQALKHMRDSLLDESTLERNFVVLILGSCIIASLGLLANSAAVIIGAMLIAPLMLPIRGVAFGILEADRVLIKYGFKALGVGTALAIAMAATIGLVTRLPAYGPEVLARTQPTLLDLGIAITAGALCGFAKVEPKLSNTLAGTAIAVALMPPLCVVGLWLAKLNLANAMGAMLLYLTNLFGITLSCMVAFWIAGYSPFKNARRPLEITLAFTGLLMLPLGYSTIELLRQAKLETSLRTALLDRTLTFQRLDLVQMQTDWLQSPPAVSLVVYAREPVTPKQVGLLEEFVATEMGRPFQLLFEVSLVEQVTSDLEPNIVEKDAATEAWPNPKPGKPALPMTPQ